MNRKKGLWIAEESGKIVLAIISIIILFILLFKLANILIKDNEYRIAKESFKRIHESILSIKEGEKKLVFLEGPAKWMLIFFEKNNKKSPSACGFRDCFCVCKNLDSCEDNGFCSPYSEKNIYLESITFFQSENQIDIISKERALRTRYISFYKTPVLIEMESKNDQIIITQKYSEDDALDKFLEKEVFTNNQKKTIRDALIDYVLTVSTTSQDEILLQKIKIETTLLLNHYKKNYNYESMVVVINYFKEKQNENTFYDNNKLYLGSFGGYIEEIEKNLFENKYIGSIDKSEKEKIKVYLTIYKKK